MSADSMKILKVKLVKGGEKLELALQESGTVQSLDNKECKNPVHPDLSAAVQALAPHLAILCDFIDPKQINQVEEIEKFTVTGYSIGGKEGEEGVIITGMRRTKTSQKYSINSPFTRFEASDESRYILMGDLESKITAIEDEVDKYLFEGKMLQPSLFKEGEGANEGEAEAVTKMQFAEPETEEEKEQAALNRLKQGGNGSDLYANPDAMQRVAEMEKEEQGAGVTDFTEGFRDKQRGRKPKDK